jgi:ankyrin repeat protein
VDQKGEEAIHFLAPVLSENSQDVLDLLLAYGANLESRNDDGETAILKAARWLNLAAVKILIQAGANYKVTNANGEGIFHSFTSISDVEAIAAIHEAIEEKTLADHGRID